MIRVITKDGATVEVANAVSAEVMGKEVVCYDRRGVIVARYPSETVTLFGPHLPRPDDLIDDDEEDEDAEVS
jgi:hypothetical protein